MCNMYDARIGEVITHLVRAVAVMQQCLWPTHRRCCWLCPLSGRLMDQRPTGAASWLPTHNQISRTACHRWKSKWVILHKLAILHSCGNNKKLINLILILFLQLSLQIELGSIFCFVFDFCESVCSRFGISHKNNI